MPKSTAQLDAEIKEALLRRQRAVWPPSLLPRSKKPRSALKPVHALIKQANRNLDLDSALQRYTELAEVAADDPREWETVASRIEVAVKSGGLKGDLRALALERARDARSNAHFLKLRNQGHSHATLRGHATKSVNEQRAESIAFGTKWAEERFREDPNYSTFTLDMVSIDPNEVPNAKRREAMKNAICTAAVKRWRALRDQARLTTAGSQGHAKKVVVYEKGQRVSVVDDRGHEIGRGHVYTGDNYPTPNERTTWVKMTRHGETLTEEWPTSRVVPLGKYAR